MEAVANRGNFWPKPARTNLYVWAPPSAPPDLLPTVVAIFNGWAAVCGVRFKVWRPGVPALIRLDLTPGTGFWVWGEGTQIRAVPRGEANVGLDIRTAAEALALREYLLHEAGHIIGLGHEMFHKIIQRLLKRAETLAWMVEQYGGTPGEWAPQIFGFKYDTTTVLPDYASIMSYWLPGFLFTNGIGMPYSLNISPMDAAFVRRPNVYGPPLR